MCIGLKVLSDNQHVFWGRTQEFDVKLPVEGIMIPRDTIVNNTLSKISAKYATAGISLDGSSERLDIILMMDGMNECGLTGGSFYFGNDMLNYATVAEAEKTNRIPLRGEEFVTWALLNCKDIDDLKEKANKVVIVSEKNMLGQVVPQHYMFTDRSGKSVVIEQHTSHEYFDIHDDPVGTMTNTPDFPWHLKNLEMYLGLSQENTKGRMIGDLFVHSPGKGSGLIGLPGDFTPQSRFIRTTILNHFAQTPKDKEAISHTFHILNTSDIPKGLMVPSNGGLHHTQYTSVYDLENETINISTYEKRAIQQFKFDHTQVAGSSVLRYTINDQEAFIPMEVKEEV